MVIGCTANANGLIAYGEDAISKIYQSSMKISSSTQIVRQVAGAIGLLFSCFIVYSITAALIDEADIRFIAVAVGFSVALTANPLAGQIKVPQWQWVGWVVDVLLVVSFCYSAWWFFEVKEELWTGF